MPRGDRSETSASVRGQMVGMINAGSSTAEVAANFGVHPNTVLKWVRRAREDEDLRSRERSGRPRCTNIEDDERMHGPTSLGRRPQLFENLIGSMKTRLQGVLNAQGDAIKY